MQERDRYKGYWHRLMISRPGENVDCTTHVAWLQGPALYVDLRQPVNLSGKVDANCLDEVTLADARHLATQEGFAGELKVSDGLAEWQRAIDFHPPHLLLDRGMLEQEGNLLVERGHEADYVEYWQRPELPVDVPCAAARMISVDDGRSAYLVQWGRHFAYARDRAAVLQPGDGLVQLLQNADPAEARQLIDCEISFGTITAAGWRIERSTLPWRKGAILIGQQLTADDGHWAVADVDSRGRPMTRLLQPVEVHGEFVLQPPVSQQAVTANSTSGPDSAPFSHVPVIDLSAIDSGDEAAEKAVVEQLRQAASQVGFLHVAGHGIAPAVIDRLRATTKRFFDLPQEEKMRCYIGNSTNHRGYVPEGEEVLGYGSEGRKQDLKEAFDLALDLPADTVPEGHPMLGPNQWPLLPGFREDIMAYYAAVFALGRKLLHGFAMALGKPADAFDHLITTPPSQLRLIHYPYNPDAIDAQGIGAHTDYECFTLLLATTPGLEVMNGAGEWIDAPPVENALVVNIGDMLEYWSGGAFVATSHRVRKVSEERYSFPLFFAVDYDVAIRPLNGGPDATPLHAGEHLYAQTIQTFRYLMERAERGEIEKPQEALPLSSFGQEYRHRKPTMA